MTNINIAAVIASYNQEKYIKEAVESLVHQVVQLVVVDDCSSDETPEILKQLSSTYKNLQVIRNKENYGVSYSFNKAVRQVTTELVMIQGGDDISLPNRSRIHLTSFGRNKDQVLSYSAPVVIDGHSHQLTNDFAPEFFVSHYSGFELEHLFYTGNFICAPSTCFPRDLFHQSGGFNLGYDALQDYSTWMKLSMFGRFYKEDSPVVKYRKHSNNLSSELDFIQTSQKNKFEMEFTNVILDFIENCTESQLKRLHKYLFQNYKYKQRFNGVIEILSSYPRQSVRQAGIHYIFRELSNESISENKLLELKKLLFAYSDNIIFEGYQN